MSEKKYMVVERDGNVLAEGMTLDIALLFMKAFCREYFMSYITLTLREHERCCAADEK